ncbi:MULTISPECIES: hypothetical protein [unclassified Bradyrhizobium]
MLPVPRRPHEADAGIDLIDPTTEQIATSIDSSSCRGTDEQLNPMAKVSHSAKAFTPKQGQYLAFIDAYTRVHRGHQPNGCSGTSASPRLGASCDREALVCSGPI